MTTVTVARLYLQDILAHPLTIGKTLYRLDMKSLDKQKLADELKEIFKTLGISKNKLFEESARKIGLQLARYLDENADLMLINTCRISIVNFAKHNSNLIFPADENTKAETIFSPPINPTRTTTVETLAARASLQTLIPIDKIDLDKIKGNPILGSSISAAIRHQWKSEAAIGLLKTAVIKLQNQGVEINENFLTGKNKHTDVFIKLLQKFLVHKEDRIKEILGFCLKQSKVFRTIKPISTDEVKLD